MKKSPKLFNLDQTDWMIIQGCKKLYHGIEYSDRLGKDAFYRIFEVDDLYEECMEIWRNRTRDK